MQEVKKRKPDYVSQVQLSGHNTPIQYNSFMRNCMEEMRARQFDERSEIRVTVHPVIQNLVLCEGWRERPKSIDAFPPSGFVAVEGR